MNHPFIAKCLTLLGTLICLSFGLAMQPAVAQTAPMSHTMKLISTDTGERYPFAAIRIDGATYHVTEGDWLFGQYVLRITPEHVIFRNLGMLSIMREYTFARIASNEANASYR